MDWERARKELQRITNTSHEFKPVFPTIEKVIEGKPALRDRVLSSLDSFELEAVPSVKLNEGSREVLEKLSKTASLSLVTLQGSRACAEVLSRLDLARFFSARFTREDSLDRATQVKMALGAMSVSKDDAVFVADRINDLNAARGLGIRFVMMRSQGDDPGAEFTFRGMREFLVALA